MGWSETGADAMCRLRCYVRDYGEEKVIDLVHYRRSRELKAIGTGDMEPKLTREELKEMLYGEHDSARVYVEKLQATIQSLEIRKKLAIRER